MNTKQLVYTLALFLFTTATSSAETGKVTISSPASGAMFSAKNKILIDYELTPSSNGDHLHLNVDGKREDILRKMKGTADVGSLSKGKHTICLYENTKSHAPTGAESCVDVVVE